MTEPIAPHIDAITPSVMAATDQERTIMVRGRGFAALNTVTVSDMVWTVVQANDAGTAIRLYIPEMIARPGDDIEHGFPTGKHSATVTLPDGRVSNAVTFTMNGPEIAPEH